MSDIQFFSKEGLASIKEELNHLITVERLAISKQIGEARDKGDLSENAEYDAAKEAQGLLELKISKLQKIVQNARLLDESKIDSSKALLLSKVTLLNKANSKEMVYTIVPEKEADFKQGKISVGSPIAKGILGKSVGDIAEIQVPAGLLQLEIIKLER
jgi:transcription elongation factor GreA